MSDGRVFRLFDAKLCVSPRDPLGHGRSTVSPFCVVGQRIPRTSLASQTLASASGAGGRGGCGRRVTGTVAVMGRRSGCLLMELMGREVEASGRAVVGLEVEVKGLAGRVVLTWVVVRGPEEGRGQRRRSGVSEWGREGVSDCVVEDERDSEERRKRRRRVEIKREQDSPSEVELQS